MDSRKTNISIIVPIYNVEPYLRRCIDSLLKQTYKNFELILVDDGSPDNCGVICDEYAAADSRVRVIHKPNGGLSDARNAGLEIASGAYIAFVDSDDWVAPDYLERMLSALEHTGADICECGILRTSGEVGVPVVASASPAVFNTVEALEQLIADREFHQHVWNKLYRKKVVVNILFPKGKTHEDEFWTYQVFGNANTVVKIQNILYFYFQRSGSIMGKSYSLKRLDALEAKQQRQAYIAQKFSPLTLPSKLNLLGSCIYAGQMSLIHLQDTQRSVAKEKIRAAARECNLSFVECLRASGTNKLWFSLSKISFWGTCILKNFLKRGL